MKKRIWLIPLCLSFVVAASVVYYSKDDEATYTTTTVNEGDITATAIATGVLQPRNAISVKSSIRGIVKELNHIDGDKVNKGTPLLTIKPEPTPEDYAASKQALELAKVKTKQTKKNLDRATALFHKKLFPESELDKAKEAFEEARLNQKLKQEQIDLIETGKATVAGKEIDNTVRSPIQGFILKKYVHEGDAVVPLSTAQEGTVLFTIADTSDMVFKGTVSEVDIRKIHIGSTAKLEIGALPDLTLHGKVSQIALQAENFDPNADIKEDSEQQTRFKIAIEDFSVPKDVLLRSGFSAVAHITLSEHKNTLVVPERTVHYEEDEPYVLVPDKQERTGFKKMKVALGLSNGIDVEVISGLSKGETIIDDANAFSAIS